MHPEIVFLVVCLAHNHIPFFFYLQPKAVISLPLEQKKMRFAFNPPTTCKAGGNQSTNQPNARYSATAFY